MSVEVCEWRICSLISGPSAVTGKPQLVVVGGGDLVVRNEGVILYREATGTELYEEEKMKKKIVSGAVLCFTRICTW